MHTVEVRVYATDDEGRRYLLHRPGDIVDDKEARRVAALAEPADEVPAPKGIDTNTNLSDLRAICDAEAVETDGLNTRSDFRHAIAAAREQRRSNPTNER